MAMGAPAGVERYFSGERAFRQSAMSLTDPRLNIDRNRSKIMPHLRQLD